MKSVHFKFRGFVSLLSTFTFLISLVSGIVLYFVPQGKVANWIHWTFWGLDKDTWGALHINSSLIFFIIIFFHIFYNWKILLNYFKNKVKGVFKLRLELLSVTIFSLFIVLASLYDLQPFAKVMSWNEDIKDYWAGNADSQPPVPHAEQMSVTEFCQQINIPVERFVNRMKGENWVVQDTSQTIKEIAELNDIAPAEIFKAVNLSTGSPSSSGSGWGRKTVEQVCSEYNIPVNDALDRLKTQNMTAESKDVIRDISGKYNQRPVDVVNTITGQTVDSNHE